MLIRYTLLALPALLFAGAPESAQAACVRDGLVVNCTDQDTNGYVSPNTSQLRLNIAPGATLFNSNNGELIGDCDELALPSVWLGDNSAVTNGGTIATSGVCGWGIALGDGGSVINRGAIVTQGKLGIGILAGDDLRVINAGSIVTHDNVAHGIYSGNRSVITTEIGSSIVTDAGGTNAIAVLDGAVIDNRGRLETISDASDGVNAGANATFRNSGVIAVSGSQSAGLRAMGGTIAIANSGQIWSLFTGQRNPQSHAVGIYADGAAVALSSSGVIAGTFAAAQIMSTGAVTLTNTGVMSTTGERRNDGTLATGGGVIVVTAAAGAAVTIANSGQITGLNGQAAFRAAGGNINFSNSGAIIGDVVFGAGEDTFALSSGGRLSGLLDGGGGADTLLLTGDGDFAAVTANMEALSKSGSGAWTVHGAHTFARQANVLDGMLRVAGDGAITTPALNIITSGVLTGAGAVAGAVSNSGTVAPGRGSGPATLTILGAYVQDSGGTLDLNVNNDGTNDRLSVGGTATLGGTLKLTFDQALRANRFSGTRSYRLIAAADRGLLLQGDFASIATNATFIDSRVTKSANGLDLTLTRLSYGAAAASRSQRAVGEVLDRLYAAPALAGVVNGLEAGTPAGAPTTLAALAPETVPALQSLGLFTLQSLRDGAVTSISDQNFSAWGQYLNRHGRASRADAAAFRYDLNGGAAGLDIRAGENLKIGALVAHSSGGADFDVPATAKLNGNFVGVNGSFGWDLLTATAGVIYGTSHPEQRRSQTLSGTTTSLSSRGSADLWSLYATLAARLDLGSVTVTPTASLARDTVSLSRFDEAAPLSTIVAASDAQSLRAGLGVRAALTAGGVRPYLGVEANKELLSGRRQAIAVLNGVPGSDFILSGAQPRGVALAMDGGLAVDLAPRLEVHAGARFTANDVFAGRSVTAGLTYRW